MTLSIRQNTDNWLPCILTDDSDFKTPETGVAFGAASVEYA
ncbi:unnamed protein product, partial [marine sediment metagenome]